MNLFLIAFLTILTPTIFQIVFGNRSHAKKGRLPFALVCVISVFAQLLSIFAALNLVFTDMKDHDRHCGMPAAAMVFWGLVMSIVLLSVIVIQLLWRQFKKRQLTR